MFDDSYDYGEAYVTDPPTPDADRYEVPDDEERER